MNTRNIGTIAEQAALETVNYFTGYKPFVLLRKLLDAPLSKDIKAVNAAYEVLKSGYKKFV